MGRDQPSGQGCDSYTEAAIARGQSQGLWREAALGAQKSWRVFGPRGAGIGDVEAISASARWRVELCKVQPEDTGLPLHYLLLLDSNRKVQKQ